MAILTFSTRRIPAGMCSRREDFDPILTVNISVMGRWMGRRKRDNIPASTSPPIMRLTAPKPVFTIEQN